MRVMVTVNAPWVDDPIYRETLVEHNKRWQAKGLELKVGVEQTAAFLLDGQPIHNKENITSEHPHYGVFQKLDGIFADLQQILQADPRYVSLMREDNGDNEVFYPYFHLEECPGHLEFKTEPGDIVKVADTLDFCRQYLSKRIMEMKAEGLNVDVVYSQNFAAITPAGQHFPAPFPGGNLHTQVSLFRSGEGGESIPVFGDGDATRPSEDLLRMGVISARILPYFGELWDAWVGNKVMDPEHKFYLFAPTELGIAADSEARDALNLSADRSSAYRINKPGNAWTLHSKNAASGILSNAYLELLANALSLEVAYDLNESYKGTPLQDIPDFAVPNNPPPTYGELLYEPLPFGDGKKKTVVAYVRDIFPGQESDVLDCIRAARQRQQYVAQELGVPNQEAFYADSPAFREADRQWLARLQVQNGIT